MRIGSSAIHNRANERNQQTNRQGDHHDRHPDALITREALRHPAGAFIETLCPVVAAQHLVRAFSTNLAPLVPLQDAAQTISDRQFGVVVSTLSQRSSPAPGWARSAFETGRDPENVFGALNVAAIFPSDRARARRFNATITPTQRATPKAVPIPVATPLAAICTLPTVLGAASADRQLFR